MLMNPVITQDGGPHQQPDGGADAVQFGTAEEQWVSYAYPDSSSDQATLTMTPDGNGFHVTAAVTGAYAGVGLSFQSDNECIDGTGWTGIQFEFVGDTAGHVVRFIVMADDDVSHQNDNRGTCRGGSMSCYGPRTNVNPNIALNMVPFDSLSSGTNDVLDRQHIIKVQWEVEAANTPSAADFMISNVRFY